MRREDGACCCKLSCDDDVRYGEGQQRIDRRFGAQRGRVEVREAAVAVRGLVVVRVIESGLIAIVVMIVIVVVVVFVVVVMLVDDRTVDVDVVVVVPDEMEGSRRIRRGRRPGRRGPLVRPGPSLPSSTALNPLWIGEKPSSGAQARASLEATRV